MKTLSFLNSITILVALSSVIFTSEIATAQETRLVGQGAGVINETGEDKTDYHVEIHSDTPMSDAYSSFSKFGSPDQYEAKVGGVGTNKITFDWDVSVKQGEKISWSTIVRQLEENKFYVKSWFTPKESPTDVPTLGWRVEADGDVFLNNVYSSAINFNSLVFQFPSEITGDSMLDLVGTQPTGVSGLLSSGTVSAGSLEIPSELLVAQFPSLEPGDLLTAQFDTGFVDAGFSTQTMTGSLGHEHQVPEPLTILGSLAAIGFGAYAERKRKPSNSSEKDNTKDS
jgi:hypothetical protein